LFGCASACAFSLSFMKDEEVVEVEIEAASSKDAPVLEYDDIVDGRC